MLTQPSGLGENKLYFCVCVSDCLCLRVILVGLKDLRVCCLKGIIVYSVGREGIRFGEIWRCRGGVGEWGGKESIGRERQRKRKCKIEHLFSITQLMYLTSHYHLIIFELDAGAL